MQSAGGGREQEGKEGRPGGGDWLGYTRQLPAQNKREQAAGVLGVGAPGHRFRCCGRTRPPAARGTSQAARAVSLRKPAVHLGINRPAREGREAGRARGGGGEMLSARENNNKIVFAVAARRGIRRRREARSSRGTQKLGGEAAAA